MRTPEQIRLIFAELRRSTAGTGIPAIDLLKLAQHIHRAYKDEDAGLTLVRDSVAVATIPFAAVDKAMRDGGWNVLDFESHGWRGGGEYIDANDLRLTSRIDQLLGPGWRYNPPAELL